MRDTTVCAVPAVHPPLKDEREERLPELIAPHVALDTGKTHANLQRSLFMIKFPGSLTDFEALPTSLAWWPAIMYRISVFIDLRIACIGFGDSCH